MDSPVNSNNDEEEDKEDSSYEAKMEKIMARFTDLWKNISISKSNYDDDDEELVFPVILSLLSWP